MTDKYMTVKYISLGKDEYWQQNYIPEFHYDSNRINSRGKLPYMTILEHWWKCDVIYLEKCETVLAEMNGNVQRAHKARETPTAMLDVGPADKGIMKRIERIVFPNGADSPSERNDVEILFAAWKFKAILITNDGASATQPKGILGNASELKKDPLNITVMRDVEAVAEVERAVERYYKHKLLWHSS